MLMWVRLLKTRGRYKVGKALNVLRSLGHELIGNKSAVEHTGEFPVKKMKTDFFKPKKLE